MSTPLNTDALTVPLIQSGLTLIQQHKLEAAVSQFQQALAINPDHAQAYTCLGWILYQQGQVEEAIRNYRNALLRNPRDASTYTHLGCALQSQGKLEEAAIYLRQAITLNSTDTKAYVSLGTLLLSQNKGEDADTLFRKAIALHPNNAELHYQIGTTLRSQGRLEEAVFYYQQAIALHPNDSTLHTKLAIVLGQLNDYEQAIAHLQQAIALDPNHLEALCNLGVTLVYQCKVAQALPYYQRAIQIKPDLAKAHTLLAQGLLLLGDLQNGFAEYEWRWQEGWLQPFSFPQPLWDGSYLDGKTIFLHGEQDFGDMLQFIRYATVVSDRGGRVVVACQSPLIRLFATIPGIEQLVAPGDPLPEFQVYAPLLTVAHILRTTLETIPSATPYLMPPDQPPYKLDVSNKHLNVGLVWATGQKSNTHEQRSCPLPLYTPLFSIAGVCFYSLQVGLNATDIDHLEDEHPIQDLTPYITDFADTAALIAQMDLVISVDTAAAHLAGALGKPVWVLLPFSPDWRWLLNRDDSPWYPTMRLFRQKQPGEWVGVIERVVEALKALVQERYNGLPKEMN